MKKILGLSILILLLSSCERVDVEPDVPQGIRNEIRKFALSEDCETGANVSEYIFQSKTVYVFSPSFDCGAADLTSNIMDEDFNILGYLGGFAGNTEINGEDFGDAEFIRTVWEN